MKTLARRKRFLSYGNTILSSALGGALGFLADDPKTAAIAGAVTGLFGKTLENVIDDYEGRQLSEYERNRAAAAAVIAVARICDHLAAGRQVRTDLFDQPNYGRSGGNELFEGMLRKAQEAYEERKVPFLGNMFANIVFEPDISLAEANFMISMVSNMTYRKLCVLALLFARSNGSSRAQLRTGEFIYKDVTSEIMALLQEIYALHNDGLVLSTDNINSFCVQEIDDELYNALLAWDNINPAGLKLSRLGSRMAALMELDRISGSDIAEVELLLS